MTLKLECLFVDLLKAVMYFICTLVLSYFSDVLCLFYFCFGRCSFCIMIRNQVLEIYVCLCLGSPQHPCCVRSVSWALRLWDRVIPSSPPALTLSSWLTALNETPLMMIKWRWTVTNVCCSYFNPYPHIFIIFWKWIYYPSMVDVSCQRFLLVFVLPLPTMCCVSMIFALG